MKALICETHGLPDVLKLKDMPSPIPKANEIHIQVAACSVNFPDILIIQNKYQFKPPLPFSPGGEVSGKVLAVGENVKHIRTGQNVFALCGWGGFAEEIVVDQHKVFPMLPNIDYSNAASLMYNFGTSYHALKDRAKLQSGETVLVLGAAGGVGLAAIELAKIMGAVVIAAASNQEKLDVCRLKGADYCIDYSTENLNEKVMEITNELGVDVVYDPVGGTYTEPALRTMAWGGRYLVVGFAAGDIPKIPMNLPLLKGCALLGVFWGQFAAKQSQDNIKSLHELAHYFSNGKIKPHIYQKYTLENSAQALQDLLDRKIIGKAVVIVNPEMHV